MATAVSPWEETTGKLGATGGGGAGLHQPIN